jgi:hypothetical protein
MSRQSAVCIRCGRFKKTALEHCRHCNFQPNTPLEIAQSHVLGPPRDFELWNRRVISTGRSMSELERISQLIRFGGSYTYPNQELDGLLAVWAEYQAMPSWNTVWDNVRRFAPVLLIAGLFALLNWGHAVA